jgi:phosphoribosyl 1,2-cyclic phosphodiesterase
MQFHTIQSGSDGNCYVLELENKFLIIEAGISLKKLYNHFFKLKRSFKLQNIIGCLITHEHGDHARFAAEYAKNGIKIYLSKGTNEKVKLKFCEIIKAPQPIYLENFIILPITSYHDANEPLNFIIQYENFIIAYITDTSKIQNLNFDIDLFVCEVNHCTEKLISNVANNEINEHLFLRVINNHLSLEYVSDFLENRKYKTKHLHCIHLSNKNIDKTNLADYFKKRFGIYTTIAENNTVITTML